jgi:hypothetical protein
MTNGTINMPTSPARRPASRHAVSGVQHGRAEAVRELECCGTISSHRFDDTVRYDRREFDILVEDKQETVRELLEGCEPITAPFSGTTRCVSGNALSSVARDLARTRLTNISDVFVGQEK